MNKKEVRVREAILKALEKTEQMETRQLKDYVNSLLPSDYRLTVRELGQKLRAY